MRLTFFFLLMGALLGCGAAGDRQYYKLTYPESALRFEKTYPLTVRVRELDIRETYRGTEFVFRPDVNEIQFYRSQRWSEKPQKMLTDLVRDHLRHSGLVDKVTDQLGQVMPDYTLGGDIEAIEELQAGDERVARLAGTFKLARMSDDVVVWTWRFDTREPVSGAEVRGTVRTLSGILSRELDASLTDLNRFFADPQGYVPPAALVAKTVAPEGPDFIGPDDGVHHPSLQKDDTPVSVGFGAVFVPSFTDGDREPLVVVYQLAPESQVVAEGKAGARIVLKPGDYEVRFGSGSFQQQTSALVHVEDGKTTVIPPTTFAALEVAVLDTQFVPFRGTYELIRMDTREDLGIGFGADELQGEALKVWVLPAGLYKLIRSGGTYRDRTDFATVRLIPGELTRFTLVQDSISGEFEGAGEVIDEPGTTEEGPWKFTGVVGGDLAFNRTNQLGEQEGWSASLDVFFDGAARYTQDEHLWVTRLELEEGQLRPADRDRFQNLSDRLYLHTIYTYHLLPWFGPYVRTGLETKLLPRYEEFLNPTDVVERDEDGDSVAGVDEDGVAKPEHIQVDRVELGGPFSPIQLKEGIGGNFQVLRTRQAELDLRLGFGALQTLSNDLKAYESGELRPVLGNNIEGVEGTIVGRGRLSRWVTLSTEFEGLAPFGDDDAVYSWRNQANIRLVSFISLSYRFNVTRDPNLGLGDDAKTEHDVQLRFSYTLF